MAGAGHEDATDLQLACLSPKKTSVGGNHSRTSTPKTDLPQVRTEVRRFEVDVSSGSKAPVFLGRGIAALPDESRWSLSNRSILKGTALVIEAVFSLKNSRTDAVALLKAWLDLILPFIQGNILNQLVFPKVQRAMSDWKPRLASALSGSLCGIVFAWLPFVVLWTEELLRDAQRRVRSLFKGVEISKDVPADLLLLKSLRPSQQTNSARARLDSSKLTNTL